MFFQAEALMRKIHRWKCGLLFTETCKYYTVLTFPASATLSCLSQYHSLVLQCLAPTNLWYSAHICYVLLLVLRRVGIDVGGLKKENTMDKSPALSRVEPMWIMVLLEQDLVQKNDHFVTVSIFGDSYWFCWDPVALDLRYPFLLQYGWTVVCCCCDLVRKTFYLLPLLRTVFISYLVLQ